MSEVDDGLLRASGLSSEVGGVDGVAGHILMLDYDDVEDVFGVVSEVERIPGVSVVLESSPGSYHGYNLGVRPIEEQITDAARKNGEMSHVRQSARRGYFVLRWTAKVHEADGAVYKPAPQIINVSVSESGLPQSDPHLRLFANQAREQGEDSYAKALETAREDVETVGEGVRIDHYQTGTDELKGRVNP